MALTFREFMALNDFNCSLFEQDSAPVSGAAPEAPENPDNKTTNQYHFDFLKRQLGMDDDGLKAALEGGSILVYKVPDYPDWGFIANGPCTATVKSRSDGNYDITFQLEAKYKNNSQDFFMKDKREDGEIIYNPVPVKDQKKVVTEKELQDMMAKPYAGMAGAGAPPMGGPPGPPGGM